MIDRNQNILRLLLVDGIENEVELLEKLGISQRQLDYSITQINQQLEADNQQQITKVNGRFLITDDLKNLLLIESKPSEVVLSSSTRYLMIPLIVLIRDQKLTLEDLSFILGVSKNTVLSDLKKTEVYLLESNLEVLYSRQDGYFINGDEWDKRFVLKKLSDYFYQQYGKSFLIELLIDGEETFKKTCSVINEVEEILKIKYTDEDFNNLTIFIWLVLLRIRNGNSITLDNTINLFEVKDSEEFRVLEYVLQEQMVSKEEVLYLTLYLLGSKSRDLGVPQQIRLPELATALWEFLSNFEENTLFVLMDKQELHLKLLNHFKPAYYRIKYNLQFENVLYEHIVKKYSVLHHFVQKSVTPLENFFAEKLDDHEISYITLFVGGHLFDNQVSKRDTQMANSVIVCPNGISMSKMIENEIKTLFPEFQFYKTVSVREYESFLLPHNIVFSTVPLKTDKQVFLVKGVMGDDDKLNLRRKVIGSLYDLDFDLSNMDQVMEIIKKYAKDVQEDAIRKEISALMIPENIKQESILNRNDYLVDVLDVESITIIDESISWHKALEIISDNLQQRGLVNEIYKNELIASFKDKPEYIMLRERILLPHLDPTRVSQKLGVSILISKEGIFYNDKMIKIIIALTTPDKIGHLQILMDIGALAKNDDIVSELSEVNTAVKAIELLVDNFGKE